MSCIYGLSIDVGIRNLAFYVEMFDRKRLLNLTESITTTNSNFCKDGTPTSRFAKVLENVYTNGYVIFFDDFDAGSDINEAFFHISDYIDSHRYIFDKVGFIVIEDQMKANTNARRVCQHLYTYFLTIYRRWTPIFLQSSSLKTRLLGCVNPKNMAKVAPKDGRNGKKLKKRTVRYKFIKNWSIDTSKKILTLRNDNDFLKIFDEYKKQDDIADSICQLQAFKLRILFETGINTNETF
jgi:hypothetical protein